MKKRVISLLLLLVMVLNVIPAGALEGANVSENDVGSVPQSITIAYNAPYEIDGKILAKKGDRFQLLAYDDQGEETPVTWTTTSSAVSLNADTGEVEVITNVGASGTSYLSFTATSTKDSSIHKTKSIPLTGYCFSNYYKEQEITLSVDGQSTKTASLTGGKSGYNVWNCEIPSGVAKLTKEPGNSNSIQLQLLRPGTVNVSFHLTINEAFSDTARVVVRGVAVEDAQGNFGKIYLQKSEESADTAQLLAFTEEEREIVSWSSADESVVTVDENGRVSAVGVGSAIVTATDDEGNKGGIKVVVQSTQTPYFESLEFSTSAFSSGVWVSGKTFKPTVLTYDLPLKNYSTSSLMLQSGTVYDTTRYTAVAAYTDSNGVAQQVSINSGKTTTLPNMPFDRSVLTITLSDREDSAKKTVYTFNVSRPRDKTKAIKSNGITLTPDGRVLSGTSYNGLAEGTLQKANQDGTLSSGTGVSGTQYYYRTFLYADVESFRMTLGASTNYAHIRYSADDGETWNEVGQGSGTTGSLTVPTSGAAEILVQLIDDATYVENKNADKDGFSATEDVAPTTYQIWVDQVTCSPAEIRMAEVSGGDWYPAFASNRYSYWIVIDNAAATPTLTYSVADGCSVKIGSEVQTADAEGRYTLALTTSQKSITVTNAEGFSATYKIGCRKKSKMDVPDKVVDYLCIGSQYTNANYGIGPETTLSGTLKSLGNFGGYITYYYEDPIIDHPNNKYGMDFYVIGNSMETNIDSMAELGQVYISEDGEKWYALAGSEHYEEKAIWDYTITYTKGEDGKSYWTDNYGNTMDYSPKNWPSETYYTLNDVATKDRYTFTGILFKSQMGTVMGDSSSTGSYAASAKFGYADYYASNLSGTTLTDVNPYVENPSKANGFDVAWAVDEQGNPVDVAGKEFHYIKVATASNIYAGAFAEKSTEVTYVIRTTAQKEPVGKTKAPTGVTLTDGITKKMVSFEEGKQVYTVDVGSMKYLSVSVDGADEADNIYVNHTRIDATSAAGGIKVTQESGEKQIRILVQNGDCEPCIYLLKVTGSATETQDLIEGIRVSASGNNRLCDTQDGEVYTATVGYRIASVELFPIADSTVTLTVNGASPASEYALVSGENVFTITGEKNGVTHTVTLRITREEAPASTGKIMTYFTLLGDEKHGESETAHTYKRGGLKTWIARTMIETETPATVLDVLEKALGKNHTFVNAGGNYISEIDGLAEFDNGALSGWMYTLNGKHADKGVAEQTVKNGDVIVFHYTDDYTVEEGSEAWSSGTSEKTEKEEPAQKPYEITVSNDQTTIRVDEKNVTEAIAEAEKKNENVVIAVSDNTSDTSSVALEVPLTTAETLAKKNLTLEVQTAFGQVYADSETLASVLSQAETEDTSLKMEITQKSADTVAEVVGETALENAIVLEVNLTVGERSVRHFGGCRLELNIPVDAQKYTAGNYYEVYIISSDGSVELVSGKCEEKAGQLVVTVGTTHLSSFVVTDTLTVPFNDVLSHWGYEAAKYVYQHALMQGTDAVSFSPDETMTRAMLVTVLYRLDGAETSTASNLFSDVGKNDWYADAVLWASSCGIVKGVSETEFDPHSPVTREQLAAILYRYAEMKGYAVEEKSDLSVFLDAKQISDWAQDALQWTYRTALLCGVSTTEMAPKQAVTRAQMATVLMRFCMQPENE